MADENEDLKDRKIIITSPDAHGKTRFGVNGVTGEIPHNKKVTVTGAEYAALQNAELGQGVSITDLKDSEDTDGEVAPVGAAEGLKAGTEASRIQAPATPAATSTEKNPLEDGEQPDDNEGLRGGDVELKEGEDGDKPADPPQPKQVANKQPGRTKGTGTTKAKANEGGKDAK